MSIIKQNSGRVLESIKIAIVQFQYIPVLIHPTINTLSEPDGHINYWLVGKKIKEDIPLFSSLPIPENYKTNILEYFSSNYQKWLLSTVTEIIDFIILKESPQIILFPEYSLPVEINLKLKEVLKTRSEGRCIVGGIGSICNNIKDKKNRFIVVNNSKIFPYGEKIIPNHWEKKCGIVGGKGELIYPIKILDNKNEYHDLNIVILMCSDFIECTNPAGSSVQEFINKEKKVKGKPSICLVPALSTTLEDMRHDKSVAQRFGLLTAIGQFSSFGGSHICSPPPLTRNHRRHPICTPSIDPGISAVQVLDIPTKFIGEYATTPVGDNEKELNEIITNPKLYLIVDNTTDELDNNIVIESLTTNIIKRLNVAITMSAMIYRSLDPKVKGILKEKRYIEEIIYYTEECKNLQDSLRSKNGGNTANYRDIISTDVLAFLEASGDDNIYLLIINMLMKYLPEDYQKKLEDIKRYILLHPLPPPTIWKM